MGDVLAAIREKAQTHQEESKAKRFRDRGGLWQPLSPSKNMLLGILNSAEFRNIAEADPVVNQKEVPKQCDVPLTRILQVKENVNPTKGKGKGKAVLVETKLTSEAMQSKLNPVKQKTSTKVGPKSRPKGKAGPDPDALVEHDSSDEVASSSRCKLPTSSRKAESGVGLGMNATFKESQQKTSSTPPTDEDTEGRLCTRGPVPRPKRVTKKRTFREQDSDSEDDGSDYHPSPAKKRRTREPVKTSTKRTTRIQVEGHRFEEKEMQADLEDEKTKIKPFSKKMRSTCDLEGTKASNMLRMRGSKRSTTTEEISSDDERPPPPKRRRTKAVVHANSKSKPQTKPMADDDPLDLKSADSVETLIKPRSRKVSKPKAPSSSGSRAKAKVEAVSHEVSDTQRNAEHDTSGSGRTAKFRNGRLSTIIEDEDFNDNQKKDEARNEDVSKEPRLLHKAVGSETVSRDVLKLPSQKRHQVSTIDEDDEMYDRKDAVILAKAPKIQARAHDREATQSIASADSKKNPRAGITKRRRKKVELQAGSIDVQGIPLSLDTVVLFQDTDGLNPESTAGTTKPKRGSRTKTKNITKTSPSDVEQPQPMKPSSLEQTQDHTFSADEAVAISPLKGTTIQRASSATQSPTRTKPKRRPQKKRGNTRPKVSSKKRKEASRGGPRESEQSKMVGSPPRLRGMQFVVESDVDELDLLS